MDTNGSGPEELPESGTSRPWWRHWWAWVAAAVVLIAAAIAVLLIVRDGDESPAPVTTEATAPAGTTASPDATSPSVTSTAGTSTSTSTSTGALSLSQIASDLAGEWPDPSISWACEPFATGSLGPGSIATCRPVPLPGEGEYPVVTALVLDERGTVAMAESGVRFPLLYPSDPMAANLVPGPVPAGLDCTELLAPTSPFTTLAASLTPAQTYVGVTLYWFLEGRPAARLDASTGRPCPSEFPPAVVDQVWAGGLIPSP